MKIGYKALIEAANREISSLAPEEAVKLLGDENVRFIDLRDRRELERDGRIPGAFNCPRGMLEFWIDPDSPYHKPIFAEPVKFVFYCASAWRSALATKTAQDMGLARVCHVSGGFSGWRKAGLPVEEVASR